MAVLHSELAERARAALKADSRTKDSTIQVVDRNGIVTLTGTARSDQARQAAEEIAGKQRDVIQIINQLKVSPLETKTPPATPVPPEEHPHIET